MATGQKDVGCARVRAGNDLISRATVKVSTRPWQSWWRCFSRPEAEQGPRLTRHRRRAVPARAGFLFYFFLFSLSSASKVNDPAQEKGSDGWKQERHTALIAIKAAARP